jgi:hypothetical protein
MDFKPQTTEDIDICLPADVTRLIPKDIPKDYPNRQEWLAWQSRWFFRGLDRVPTAKPGIEPQVAIKHLACIQRSMELSMETKKDAVAYLASLWFEEPT